MELRDMIEILGGGAEHVGTIDAPQCPISGEDAIAALKAGQKAWATKHGFNPGDLIIQKDGLYSGLTTGARGGNPAIFLEYIDDIDSHYDLAAPGNPFTVATKDCIIGWIAPDGAFVISPAMSDVFEPYQG